MATKTKKGGKKGGKKGAGRPIAKAMSATERTALTEQIQSEKEYKAQLGSDLAPGQRGALAPEGMSVDTGKLAASIALIRNFGQGNAGEVTSHSHGPPLEFLASKEIWRVIEMS